MYERGCASGNSPEGRIVSSSVIYFDASVTVILGTRPLPGPQTCQTGPPAEFLVELRELLGDRQVFDGWVFPPEMRATP